MDHNSSSNPTVETSPQESDELVNPSQVSQPVKTTQSPLNNAVKAGGKASSEI